MKMAFIVTLVLRRAITTRAANTLALISPLLLVSILSQCTVLLEAFLTIARSSLRGELARGNKTQPCLAASLWPAPQRIGCAADSG